jgi:hypothetical protein
LRSFTPEAGRAPLDEPPFLDTDIGRAVFLVTIETFVFFLEEHNITSIQIEHPETTRFVAVKVHPVFFI